MNYVIIISVQPSQLSCASQGIEGKSCMKGGGKKFSVVRNDAWCLSHRITESQNVRGWKGPLWVI